MKESRFKNSVGFFIVVFHFSIILLTIGLHVMGGFSFEQMTTTIALIIPMVGVYTTAVAKHFIATQSIKNIKSKDISRDYVWFTIFILSVYFSSLISLIFLKSFNIAFSDFEEFKTMLGLLQTAFGVYAGLILSSMFEIEITKVEETQPKGFFGKVREIFRSQKS
ncbi:MAG: hypothetical protein J7647_20220 [Cyanobacteria bacterium SBLK]|nr:hypothetical protein [Cyanobacteria bacterium SBLK]